MLAAEERIKYQKLPRDGNSSRKFVVAHG